MADKDDAAEPVDEVEPLAEGEKAANSEEAPEGGTAREPEPESEPEAEPAAETESGAKAESREETESGAETEPGAEAEPAAEPESAVALKPAPVPPPRRRRASKLLVTGRVLVGLVSATALAAMSLVYLRVDELDQSKNTTDAVVEAQEGPNAPPIEADDDGANDILIVGNDSRTDMQGRPLSAKVLRELRTEATDTTNTDTLILLRIPHDGGKASAISIPRDTSVRVPEPRTSMTVITAMPM